MQKFNVKIGYGGKIHLAIHDGEFYIFGVWRTYCGKSSIIAFSQDRQATCQTCLKMKDKVEKALNDSISGELPV